MGEGRVQAISRSGLPSRTLLSPWSHHPVSNRASRPYGGWPDPVLVAKRKVEESNPWACTHPGFRDRLPTTQRHLPRRGYITLWASPKGHQHEHPAQRRAEESNLTVLPASRFPAGDPPSQASLSRSSPPPDDGGYGPRTRRVVGLRVPGNVAIHTGHELHPIVLISRLDGVTAIPAAILLPSLLGSSKPSSPDVRYVQFVHPLILSILVSTPSGNRTLLSSLKGWDLRQ